MLSIRRLKKRFLMVCVDISKTELYILISHRISTVMNADRIIVLDDGMIKEEGSHEDLINRNGIYAEISRLQALEEELNK